jgi:hypothetical protein
MTILDSLISREQFDRLLDKSVLEAENDTLRTQLATAREALETLAKLGNGDKYGNSIGNEIAQKALKKMEG